MKFDCGETALERLDRLSTKHRWFAWFPVKVASHDCRWLEYVEREGFFSRWGDCKWTYKEWKNEQR